MAFTIVRLVPLSTLAILFESFAGPEALDVALSIRNVNLLGQQVRTHRIAVVACGNKGEL